MAGVALSFVEDLNADRDFWNIKARIIKLWKRDWRWDFILIDERGRKVQAVVKKALFPDFHKYLHEDAVLLIKKFGVAAQDDKHPVLPLEHKINFFKCTSVEAAGTFSGHPYGFHLVSFSDITGDKCTQVLTVDIIGRVAWAGNIEVFKSKEKESKRMHIDLQDLEGNVLRCTFWGGYADLCNSFVASNNSNEMVIVIVQHGRVKQWGGQNTVQNDMFATRIFWNEDVQEANDFRRRMIVKLGPSNSQTVLSSQTSYPQHEEFVVQTPNKKVDEIIEVDQDSYCVVVATITMVEQMHGWFYKAHRKCGRKAYTKSDYLEHAKKIPDNFIDAPMDSLWCLECQCLADSLFPKFKVQFRVQDNSGSVSFVMFDKDVSKVMGISASDIRERQLKSGDMDSFPHELNNLENKVLAFKILVSRFNLENNYHIYTVSKLCEDMEIIQELQAKDQAEPVTPEEGSAMPVRLDEESQQGGDSKDVTSGTASSLDVDVDKNTATSPSLKRSASVVAEGNEGDQGSAVRTVKKKLS